MENPTFVLGYTCKINPFNSKKGGINPPSISSEIFYCGLLSSGLSNRHPDEHIILLFDGAASHRGKTLKIPDNLSLIPLPPYSPELNPVENFWKELKKQGFYNRTFTCMKQVEDLLEKMLKHFEENPELVRSIVAFDWIVSALNS